MLPDTTVGFQKLFIQVYGKSPISKESRLHYCILEKWQSQKIGWPLHLLHTLPEFLSSPGMYILKIMQIYQLEYEKLSCTTATGL